MDKFDEVSLLMVDSVQQVRFAVKSLHDLALDLEKCAAGPSSASVDKISYDLSCVGWNALYASRLVADLSEIIRADDEKTGGNEPPHIFQQLDSLLIATNYFSRSVADLKRFVGVYPLREETRNQLAELYIRLREATHECKSLQ